MCHDVMTFWMMDFFSSEKIWINCWHDMQNSIAIRKFNSNSKLIRTQLNSKSNWKLKKEKKISNLPADALRFLETGDWPVGDRLRVAVDEVNFRFDEDDDPCWPPPTPEPELRGSLALIADSTTWTHWVNPASLSAWNRTSDPASVFRRNTNFLLV